MTFVIENGLTSRIQVDAQGRLAGIQQRRQSAATQGSSSSANSESRSNGAGPADPWRERGQNSDCDSWLGTRTGWLQGLTEKTEEPNRQRRHHQRRRDRTAGRPGGFEPDPAHARGLPTKTGGWLRNSIQLGENACLTAPCHDRVHPQGHQHRLA